MHRVYIIDDIPTAYVYVYFKDPWQQSSLSVRVVTVSWGTRVFVGGEDSSKNPGRLSIWELVTLNISVTVINYRVTSGLPIYVFIKTKMQQKKFWKQYEQFIQIYYINLTTPYKRRRIKFMQLYTYFLWWKKFE